MHPRQDALGKRDVLVELVDDLVQLLAYTGVLLNLRLELLEERRVDHGRHYVELKKLVDEG